MTSFFFSKFKFYTFCILKIYFTIVLQAAQAVLVALFELNPSEFTMLLGALPKTFQDGATRLLHTHLKAPVKTNTVSSFLCALRSYSVMQ